MKDGREVSAFWGGATNPDGSKKKKATLTTKAEVKARHKAKEAERSARRKAVRKLFEERRNALEQLNAWQGPRKFEEWLLRLAEGVLVGGDKAAAPEMPEVCAY